MPRCYRETACSVAENSRAELDPGAMLGAAERICGVKARGRRLFEIFENDGRLEQCDLADAQNGRLAQRRQCPKPLRFVGEVDVDPFEVDRLFLQRNHRPLHIGTKMMADESELPVHVYAAFASPSAASASRTAGRSPMRLI